MALIRKIAHKLGLLEQGSAASSLWRKNYQKTLELAEKTLHVASDETKEPKWDGEYWSCGDLLYGYLASKKLGTSRPEFISKSLIPKPLTRCEMPEITREWLGKYSKDETKYILSQPPCPTILIAACAGIASNTEYLIETGTYLGASSLMVSQAFDHVYTVEADPVIADCARDLHRSAEVRNISVTTGNSSQYLASLEDRIIKNSVVYLDAHFSGGPTSRRYGETPLAKELKIVLGKAPVICIDDIRHCGKRGYPTISDIISNVTTDYQVTIAYDQLVLRKRGNPLDGIMDVKSNSRNANEF